MGLGKRAIVDGDQQQHHPVNRGSLVFSQRGIRIANILAASAKGMTRPELAQVSGISAATLQRALNDLRAEDWVENGNGGGSAGEIRLGRKAGLVVGVDVGRAHRRAVVADAHGAMIGDPVDQDLSGQPEDYGPGLLSGIADLVVKAVEEASKVPEDASRPAYTLGEIRAIGVGVPFPVSPHGTTVGMFVPELSGLNLGEKLKELLRERATDEGTELRRGVKVRFAKDGDLGALALWRDHLQEHLHERHEASDAPEDADEESCEDAEEKEQLDESVLFLKASFGLDAGIVCHGLLVAGGRGLAGQIGHMWLPRLEEPLASAIYGGEDGEWLPEPSSGCPRCNRRYCLENVASGRAIIEELKRAAPTTGQPNTVEQLVGSASGEIERGDIRRALIRAASLIGVVLADAARLADPTRIVVGGLLAEAGETFMTPLRITFAEAGLPGLEPTVVPVERNRIRTIELEGAIALALKHVEFQWR